MTDSRSFLVQHFSSKHTVFDSPTQTGALASQPKDGGEAPGGNRAFTIRLLTDRQRAPSTRGIFDKNLKCSDVLPQPIIISGADHADAGCYRSAFVGIKAIFERFSARIDAPSQGHGEVEKVYQLNLTYDRIYCLTGHVCKHTHELDRKL